ncbi:MAG: ribonuclease III [Candidatus Moraniibacteriota bacterium]|nr:MAG: ribonuclease III [Candidatus Moranbacteria bacterium]
MMNTKRFANICGISLKNADFFIEAMTHRSYLNENKKHAFPHNERLEFLGDAVLELIVTEYLYHEFDNPEGEMTAWRAALVNGEMLARVAREIGIEEFLMMSKGEAKDIGKARNYLLANAMEAIIGALYLDGGYENAKAFIYKWIIAHMEEILEKKLYLDPKSYFQEKAQEQQNITPHYKLISESGPDHDRVFIVGVFLGEEEVAQGTGKSKQDAQRDAARKGLEKKQWL